MKTYLDHAATTPPFPEVVKAMSIFMMENFGNPSSIHSCGREAKVSLEHAREQVASLLNAPPETIYFTSGGTEADNIAILGAAITEAHLHGKKHIITSAVEHHAVLETCEELFNNMGYELSILPVDQYGMVSPELLQRAMRPDTALVSLMYANNEVGAINPIKELAQIAHQAGALFHCDAVQAVGKIACDVLDLGVDMLSISAHKINGPKGVGALYKRDHLPLYPRIFGGGQEKTIRSGTENTPGIVGFGIAAEITKNNWQRDTAEHAFLRDKFVEGVLSTIPHTQLNGHPEQRIPSNANISFDFINGAELLAKLDEAGIACSSGSACSAGSTKPSHVLQAMGLHGNMLASAIRFSIGLGVDDSQIDYCLQVLQATVAQLREQNPAYHQ